MGSRVAVIGAGIGGLVAALDVVQGGGSAVLFEATGSTGGRARTRRDNGFSLNQGPHALYLAGSLAKALRDFGVPVHGRGPDLARGAAIWGGNAHAFPLARTGQPAVRPLDEDSNRSLLDFYQHAVMDGNLGRGRPLSEVLAALAPVARSAVEGLVRLSTYIHAPGEVDARAALDQLRLSFSGSLYVDGGWQSLVDGLTNAAESAGVRIRTGARVLQVSSAGSRLCVEWAGHQWETFDAVILAVPPQGAVRLVPASADLQRAVESARPVRVAAVDLALTRPMRAPADFVLGFDEPTYLSTHSAVAALAPDGGAVVHMARYLAPGEPASASAFAELERLADGFDADWRSSVVYEQRLAGAVVAHDFPHWRRRGARAANRLGDTPGIFLAGDWIGESGMLADAVAASARRAARDALDDAKAPKP